jgi:hypothetical protein
MPNSFENWQDWALEVTTIINGRSNWFRAFLPQNLHKYI